LKKRVLQLLEGRQRVTTYTLRQVLDSKERSVKVKKESIIWVRDMMVDKTVPLPSLTGKKTWELDGKKIEAFQ